MPTWLSSSSGRNQDSRLLRRLAVAVVMLATFAVYVGTVDFGFVYDDESQIVLNPFLRSWHYLSRYFVRDVWSQAGRGEESNYYRPIFMLWLRLNYVFFGLKPAGWHLLVVLLHVGVTFLVYRLGVMLLKDWRKSVFLAAFFGLNPVHLEAVAWIAGVTEPLLGAFVLLAFISYLKSCQTAEHQWRWMAASWLFYALATLAKETAVMFPLAIAAYDWFLGPAAPAYSRRGHSTEDPLPRGRRLFSAGRWRGRLKSALKAAGPYLLITLLYLYVRILVLGVIISYLSPKPWPDLLFTLPSVLMLYARLLAWPGRLSIYYDLDWILHPTVMNFGIPATVLILIVLALTWWSRRRPLIGFAALWTLLWLGPVLDVGVFPAGNFVQDRYLYVPSVGFGILLIELLALLLPSRVDMRRLSTAGASLACVILIGYGAGTMVQSTYWADNTLLFYHALQAAPHSPFPKNDLGAALIEQKHWKKATGVLRAALEADPSFGYPWGNLAYMYYVTGEYRKAVQCAEKFLRFYPDNPDGYYLLGISEYEGGRLRRAAQFLGYALTLKPHAYGFHYALGLALLKQGHPRRALIEFEAEPRHSTKRADAEKQIAAIRGTLRARSQASPVAP